MVASLELAPRPVLPKQTLDQASLLGDDAWRWVVRHPLRALVCLHCDLLLAGPCASCGALGLASGA